MEQTLYFYAETEAYFELSNFYLRAVTIDDIAWPSTEHYYQAQKFLAAADRERIRSCNSAAEAFLLGQNLATERVGNWEDIKVAVMYKALKHKFKQHSDLKQVLLATGEAVIKEKSLIDSFWGIGADGKGANLLGILLMELRAELNSSEKPHRSQNLRL
jgi:ribA/ribD-fused uncharacterized protein